MKISAPAPQGRAPFVAAFATLFFLLVLCACQGPAGMRTPATASDSVPPSLPLAPGDLIEITFPAATNLNSVHRIGPEGTITMPLLGQIQASGLTTDELAGRLMNAFKNELKEPNVIVSMAGSANGVYVTGAVLRPGRIQLDRPLTALEAIMETGGFAETANRKRVRIIRYNGTTNTITELNLEPVLVGGPVPPFYVKPRDIIDVPTKIQWF